MSLTEFQPTYIAVRKQDDFAVVTFTVAYLDDEENIQQLGNELFTLVEQFGFRKLIISMADVEFFTSSVLGKLISLHRKLHRRQGKLAICDLRDPVPSVMRTSKLMEYFTITENIDEAIETLKQTHSSANSDA